VSTENVTGLDVQQLLQTGMCVTDLWFRRIFSKHCKLTRSFRQALSSSETSVITRATWRNIPEDAVLHNQSTSLRTL
jgi:hypothetical protein